MNKMYLIRLIELINRKDIIKYLCIITEDIVMEQLSEKGRNN